MLAFIKIFIQISILVSPYKAVMAQTYTVCLHNIMLDRLEASISESCVIIKETWLRWQAEHR